MHCSTNKHHPFALCTGYFKADWQLEQLADMFNDLNLIVERQGEQIDRIEDLINNTQDYMEKGIKQLDGAKKHQNANRKWICIMLIIAVIILIIVCIPLIQTRRIRRNGLIDCIIECGSGIACKFRPSRVRYSTAIMSLGIK